VKQKQLAEQQWNKKHTAVQQPYKWNKITRLKNSGKYYGGKMHVTTKLRETDNPDRAHWRSRACHFPHSLLITCAHTCMHTHIHTHACRFTAFQVTDPSTFWYYHTVSATWLKIEGCCKVQKSIRPGEPETLIEWKKENYRRKHKVIELVSAGHLTLLSIFSFFLLFSSTFLMRLPSLASRTNIQRKPQVPILVFLLSTLQI
jgi:hypothetical protein